MTNSICWPALVSRSSHLVQTLSWCVAIPAMLANLDPAKALLEMVEDMERGEIPLKSTIESRIILRVCKSAAIKAGQTLSLSEMEAMVRQLEQCQQSPYLPPWPADFDSPLCQPTCQAIWPYMKLVNPSIRPRQWIHPSTDTDKWRRQ